jgi:dTDP-4-dehydrorhamnose 3,5-epimerase
LRGLHYQKPPYTQGKLVRCLQGEVLDVAVDIRWGSPTYGQHVVVKLNDENQYQLWIPRGFAHGFAVLSETAVFSYKCDRYYAPMHEGGIFFNDPALNIDWLIPATKLILSEKDKKLPLFDEINIFKYQELPVLSR